MKKPGPGRILVVDDEANNRLLLNGMLKRLGHEPLAVENAIVALRTLDRTFDLVLADVVMPEMDGFEMVRRIRGNPEIQDIPVIMVTTLSDKDDRLQAVQAGANDFITKPVDPLELCVRTSSLLRQKAQQDDLKTFQTELHDLVGQRTQELRQALHNLDKAHVESIRHLSAAAEYKDENTASHIVRMARYSALLAEKIELEKSLVELILTSSPMHDVGKIGIPDIILLKPGKLDPGEWEIMKTHTTIGAKILGAGDSEYMSLGTIIALSHHEKWDGSGYPSGMSGEDIPLVGRICAVADVFDALTSRRPYKPPFPVDDALAIMRQGRGTHFDPTILDVFLANFDTILSIRNQYPDSE